MCPCGTTIELPDDKSDALCHAAAQNAAVFAGGELRSAYVETDRSLGLLSRLVGPLAERTEIFPSTTTPA